MKVYGYTDDKDVVAIDLSIDKIVSAGIDPWRLDLFDPDPIRVKMGWFRGSLKFSKLRDLSFAHGHKDTAVVGLHSGDRPICLVGKCEGQLGPTLRLSDFSESPHLFAEHFAEYLVCFEVMQPKPTRTAFARAPKQKTTFLLPPTTADAVSLRGDKLELVVNSGTIIGSGKEPPMFCGQMYHEQLSAAQLPERINWALRALSEGQPSISGESMRDAMTGKPIEEVVVEVVSGELPLIRKFLLEHHCVMRQAPGILYFEFEGCKYFVKQRPLRMPMSERIEEESGLYSADALYCLEPNKVRGSRIALFDLSRKQARRLYNPAKATTLDVVKGRLIRDGFKVLEI